MPPEISTEQIPETFGERVGSLPLVNLTMGKVQSYYQGTKERFPLVQTVQNFIPQITPQTFLSPKMISQIDQVACQGLSSLERNVPIIREQPEKVMEIVQTKLYDPLEHLLQKALVYSEENLDLYLPPSEEEGEKKEEGAEEEKEKEKEKEKEGEDLPEAKRQKFEGLQRAQMLGVKISKRVSSLALKQLSPEQMRKIVSTILENVESQMASLRASLKEGNILKSLDSHFLEFRNGLNQLLESAEKITPTAQSLSNLFLGISKKISEFSDQLYLVASKSFDSVKNEHYLRIIASLKENAEMMAKFAANVFPKSSSLPSQIPSPQE